jgi:hypothetical protein
MKDNIQSARLAGFGGSGSAVELFVRKQNLQSRSNPKNLSLKSMAES